MEGRLGALLAIQLFRCDFCDMKQPHSGMHTWIFGILAIAAGCTSCGGGNDGPLQVRIDQIEIRNINPDYAQDPWPEEGGADFYFSISVENQLYWDSEQTVVMNASTPLVIPTAELTFAGGELDQTVTIVVWDADALDDPISGDDYVGEVSFVPRDLMASEPARHPLFGGYLEIELLLTW